MMKQLAEDDLRSYVSEPRRPRRRWDKDRAAQRPTYANRNRRRINCARGKRLQRRRGEPLERSFVHLLEPEACAGFIFADMRTSARMLIHAAGFNLGLVMRARFGYGIPRGLQGLRRPFSWLVSLLGARCADVFGAIVALVSHITVIKSIDARAKPAIHPQMALSPLAVSPRADRD